LCLFNDSYQRQTYIARKWLQVNCPEFIRKDQWPPNSPDPWTAMSWVRCWRPITSSCPKPKSVTKLKEALQVIWDSLPQDPVNEAVKSFTIQPKRCTKAGDEHCEHTHSDCSTSEKLFTVLFQ